MISHSHKYNRSSNIQSGNFYNAIMQENINRIPKSDYLLLPFIMAVAYYLAFIPHHGYPYLVHLDEWIHLACSNQVITQATATGLTNPWFGGEPNAN